MKWLSFAYLGWSIGITNIHSRYAAEVVVGESGGCSLDSEGSHLQPEDDRVVVAVAVVKMLGRDSSGGWNVAGGGGSHMGFSSKLVHLSRKVQDITEWEEDADEYIRTSHLNSIKGEETQEKTYNGMIKRANENSDVAKQGLQGRVIGKVNEGELLRSKPPTLGEAFSLARITEARFEETTFYEGLFSNPGEGLGVAGTHSIAGTKRVMRTDNEVGGDDSKTSDPEKPTC
ncbi:hypothetical protein Tco_0013073 [Tanacetum coccineum]